MNFMKYLKTGFFMGVASSIAGLATAAVFSISDKTDLTTLLLEGNFAQVGLMLILFYLVSLTLTGYVWLEHVSKWASKKLM